MEKDNTAINLATDRAAFNALFTDPEMPQLGIYTKQSFIDKDKRAFHKLTEGILGLDEFCNEGTGEIGEFWQEPTAFLKTQYSMNEVFDCVVIEQMLPIQDQEVAQQKMAILNKIIMDLAAKNLLHETVIDEVSGDKSSGLSVIKIITPKNGTKYALIVFRHKNLDLLSFNENMKKVIDEANKTEGKQVFPDFNFQPS